MPIATFGGSTFGGGTFGASFGGSTSGLEPPTIYVSAVNPGCTTDFPWERPAIAITITNPYAFNLVGEADASFEGTTGSAVGTDCALSLSPISLDGNNSLEVKYNVPQPPGSPPPGSCSVLLGPYTDIAADEPYTVMVNCQAGSLSFDLEVDLQFFDEYDNYLGEISGTGTNTAGVWLPMPGIAASGDSPIGTAYAMIRLALSNLIYALARPVPSVAVHGTAGTTPYGYVATAVNAFGETDASVLCFTDTGNAVLDSTNYNIVSWPTVANAASYNVYRGRQGLCGDLPVSFATCAAVEEAFATCGDLITEFFAAFGLVGSSTTTSFDDTGTAPGVPPPSTNTSGPQYYFDELGVMFGAGVMTWIIDQPGVIVVQRQNSDFVQGASPTDPLVFLGAGQSITIFDYAAPYGLPVSYIAWLIAGQRVTLPTPLSPPVTMGEAPDTCSLWKRTGWAADVDVSGELMGYLAGIGNWMQGIDSIAADQMLADGTSSPGWSQILDIDRCPKAFLPWLGQFVGARFPTDLRDDEQRAQVSALSSQRRGTPAAMVAGANAHLLPGFTAVLNERTPDAYSFNMAVPEAGVIGDASCLSIALGYPFCSTLMSVFPTCADMWAGVNAVLQAVESSIPAGLIGTVSFI